MFPVKSAGMFCSFYVTLLLQSRDFRISDRAYLSVVCLQKSNNVYEVVVAEEMKKRFIFEIKLYGNELCVFHYCLR